MDSLKQSSEEEIQISEGRIQALTRNLSTKRSWQLGALILIILVFMFVRFISPSKEKSHEIISVSKSELPEVYKEKDLKRALKQNMGTEKKTSLVQSSKQEKRNYGTEIAVFIFKEKEIRNANALSKREEAKKLGLPAGTKIPAYLSGTIFSFNVEAPVTARVSKDIEKDGRVVIPKDAELLGEAGILKSLNRINVNFHLLIFPDGREVRIRAMALSEDGSSGIKGRVSKHRDIKVLKALGETALAGMSLFAAGVRSEPYALEDQMRMNLAQNLTGEARQDLRSVKVDTSITADNFTPIQVILLEAV